MNPLQIPARDYESSSASAGSPSTSPGFQPLELGALSNPSLPSDIASESQDAEMIPPALRLDTVHAIRHALETVDKLDTDLRSRLLGLLDDLSVPASPEGEMAILSAVGTHGVNALQAVAKTHTDDGEVLEKPVVQAAPIQEDVSGAMTGPVLEHAAWSQQRCSRVPQVKVSSPPMISPGGSEPRTATLARLPQQGLLNNLSSARDLFKMRIHASEEIRKDTLSLARDQYKMRIRALERSDEFHSMFLRELEVMKAPQPTSEGSATGPS